jgi:hypothetical protein
MSNNLKRFGGDKELRDRFFRLMKYSAWRRTMLVHITNKCNLRCRGCWFFEDGFDRNVIEETEPEKWREFAHREALRGINTAVLIGGEPTLYPQRIASIRERIPCVTVSTNGEVLLSKVDFPDVTIALTMFGGIKTDAKIRAIRYNGKPFSGLMDRVLQNYQHDQRAGFVYGLSSLAIDEIRPTVRIVQDAGLRVTFNFYRDFCNGSLETEEQERRLIDEAMAVADAFPETVISHPYYIEALLSGKTEWGEFNGETCPTASIHYPGNTKRLANGHPFLTDFNAYSSDLRPTRCCNGGNCDSCRDSQVISSWLLVNSKKFMRNPEMIKTWVDMSEAYWSQFVWSPYHPSQILAVNNITKLQYNVV